MSPWLLGFNPETGSLVEEGGPPMAKGDSPRHAGDLLRHQTEIPLILASPIFRLLCMTLPLRSRCKEGIVTDAQPNHHGHGLTGCRCRVRQRKSASSSRTRAIHLQLLYCNSLLLQVSLSCFLSASSIPRSYWQISNLLLKVITKIPLV